MPDDKGNLFLFEAIELRNEYDRNIKLLKKLTQGDQDRGDRFFNNREEEEREPAQDFNQKKQEDRLKKLKMIKGIDFIGIVPEKIIPVYCHGSFPDEDKINYFMNLGFERIGDIIEKSYWYPIEQVRLKGSTPVS